MEKSSDLERDVLNEFGTDRPSLSESRDGLDFRRKPATMVLICVGLLFLSLGASRFMPWSRWHRIVVMWS